MSLLELEAPPQTVERYVVLARQRRETGRRQRHSWVTCCILCADVREHLGIKPPAIRIGAWSTGAQAVEARP